MKTKNLLLIILVAMQSYTAFTQSYILRGNPNPPSGTVNTNIYQTGNFLGFNTTTPTGNVEIRSACAEGNAGSLLISRPGFTCNILSPQTYGDYFIIRQDAATGDPTFPFIIKNSGRIGVGAGNNPDATFDLRGGSGLALISAKDNNNNVRFVAHGDGSVAINTSTTTNALLEMKNNSTSLPIILARDNSNNVKLSLTNDGRMGINQQTPTTTLEVKSNNSGHNPLKAISNTGATKLFVRNDDRHVIIGGENALNDAALTINETNNNGGIELLASYSNGAQVYNRIFFTKIAGGNRHFIGDDNSNGRLVIDPGLGAGASDILQVKGKTIIGNTAPTSTYSTYQLGVDGDIVAKKVIVQTGNWADYVFDDNYKLKPLNEVAAFIKKNKHLPEIPSEKEILANGIDTGEMNRLLLQKVEELTLYLIKQQEQINLLKSKIK